MKKGLGRREYRCTRRVPYLEGYPGFECKSARQGYYIVAASAKEAYRKMCDMFPDEVSGGFDVELWDDVSVSVYAGE